MDKCGNTLGRRERNMKEGEITLQHLYVPNQNMEIFIAVLFF